MAALLATPRSSPLRTRYLLFLDDDSAIAPGALAQLVRCLEGRPKAVAACPNIEPTHDLAKWLADQVSTPATGAGAPGPLPGALRGGRYDLLSVTSHGSLITGRVVGMLARQAPVLSWLADGGRLFYTETPYGSGEDMLAMAALSRLGELWRVPGAVAGDRARATPGRTRAQQFAWGYDHAWLAGKLASAGLLEEGVHSLTWEDGRGWMQATITLPGHIGFLVNPDELQVAADGLSALSGSTATQLFGEHATGIDEGLQRLCEVMHRHRRLVTTSMRRSRPDLPPLVPRRWDTLRDGLDALLGHVAGNALGSLQHELDAETGLPRRFLYGARQPATSIVTP